MPGCCFDVLGANEELQRQGVSGEGVVTSRFGVPKKGLGSPQFNELLHINSRCFHAHSVLSQLRNLDLGSLFCCLCTVSCKLSTKYRWPHVSLPLTAGCAPLGPGLCRVDLVLHQDHAGTVTKRLSLLGKSC